MNEAIRMQLSAFIDGELPENEKEMLLRRLSQDAELRRQVAEFLAIGRAMRGEIQVDGLEGLRERIASGIGDDSLTVVDTEEPVVENRFLKPLAGLAIAATVAFVAIFGLQQAAVVDELDPVPAEGITQVTADEYVDQLMDSHRALSAENGASNYNTRVVSERRGTELVGEEIAEPATDDAEDEDAEDEQSVDDAEALTTE